MQDGKDDSAEVWVDEVKGVLCCKYHAKMDSKEAAFSATRDIEQKICTVQKRFT